MSKEPFKNLNPEEPKSKDKTHLQTQLPPKSISEEATILSGNDKKTESRVSKIKPQLELKIDCEIELHVESLALENNNQILQREIGEKSTGKYSM